MGDKRRFDIVGRFIAANYRKGRVADVAGGKGYLALALAEQGFESVVIDPRPRDRNAMGSHREKKVGRMRCEFRDPRKFDLAVGLHPDGATEALARAAVYRPVAIVPCCHYWDGPESHGSPDMPETIRRLWRNLGVAWRETCLPMTGKNLVMWTQESR